MLSQFPGAVRKRPVTKSSIPRSVHVDARAEAEKHKWIVSEQLGRDAGHQAIEDWYRQFWNKYCRARRLEHLAGEQQWTEFKEEEFGRMYDLLMSGNAVLLELIARFEFGWENLDFITWVHEEEKSRTEIDGIIDLLAMININITRMDPREHPHHT